jgi:acyl-CoA reductase-like NAD-dependent aldehyde dehydrogenase
MYKAKEVMVEVHKMWIGGEWVSAESGEAFTVFNPSTEEELGQVPLGGNEDADKAVKEARKALPAWSKMAPGDRARIVAKIAAAVRESADELVMLEVLEHGTPIQVARGMVAGGADIIEYAASVSRALMGQVIPAPVNTLSYLKRVPLGVCASITPWNVPFLMMALCTGPALAAGNTCVLKPASISSLLGLKYAEILEKADVPRGVVNVVTGPGGAVGEALASHPGVDVVRFTGSSATGKEIMTAASQTTKKVIMELGGNNPVIVLEDADVDAMLKVQVPKHFSNSGQNCSQPGRYYVHERLYDEFVEKFVAEAKKVVVGDPRDERTTMGPVANRQQRDKVEYYVKSALDEGGRVVLGGSRPTKSPLDKGYFVIPTVVADVRHDMTIAREEIFGPAACILKFSSEEDVIAEANDSPYGLCAYIYTRDTVHAMKLADDLNADTVFVNTPRLILPEHPWGGNVKESGVCKDGSVCGIEELTDLKLICIALGQ